MPKRLYANEDYSPSALPLEIQSLSWRRVVVGLRNHRNVPGSAHPLSVFQAILYSATPPALRITGKGKEQGESFFLFHPLDGSTGQRIKANRLYKIAVVFAKATEEQVKDFLQRLDLHLMNGRNNFTLESVTGPENRTLALLETEQPFPDAPEELGLYFHTPFAFTPETACANTMRQTLLSAGEFLRLLSCRIHALTGVDPRPFLTGVEQGLRLNPYYWEYRQFNHRSQSTNKIMHIKGAAGPLFLRGSLAPLLPLLRIVSELHYGMDKDGQAVTFGRGAFVIRHPPVYFDDLLGDILNYRELADDLRDKSDYNDEIAREFFHVEDMIRQVHQEINNRSWKPRPARGMMLPKKSGGVRRIVTLNAPDYFVHKLLHRHMEPVIDRMLEECCFSYRRGRTMENARAEITRACREGYSHVLESDIDSFFDAMDWGILLEKLRGYLPLGDLKCLDVLERILRTPLVLNGKVVERCRGVLQGSPLSPMLSNLYLDSFDEAMEQREFRMVRYGDDFIILARTCEEAEEARAAAASVLSGLGLTLKEEKTAITAIETGFTFLGMEFGPDADEDLIEQAALRKTLFIRPDYSFIGLDYDALIIRRDGELSARVPLRRIGEIIVFGTHTLSTKLIHRCSQQRIPVSFCSPSGYYMNTLWPDSKSHFLFSATHANRHAGLTDQECLRIASSFVQAKIHNYRLWLSRRCGDAAPLSQLDQAMRRSEHVAAVAELRGVEGDAARVLFSFINRLATKPGFRSKERVKRKKADRYNSLLDFAYSLLFSRLNVLVRCHGLNPYLGLLHSHLDNYESLVCDLQEPFRCRMDRMVLRIINKGIIDKNDFEQSTERGLRLKPDCVGRFLDYFEQEMDTKHAEDDAPLRQLLIAQVKAVCAWVREGKNFRVYLSGEKL